MSFIFNGVNDPKENPSNRAPVALSLKEKTITYFKVLSDLTV